MKTNTLASLLAFATIVATTPTLAASYQFVDLGTLGGTHSNAYAINNSGQVAGYSYTTSNLAVHATLWTGATATDLGTLGGTSSLAYAINASGQVVGNSQTTSNTTNTTMWNGATVTDLGTLGGNSAQPCLLTLLDK